MKKPAMYALLLGLLFLSQFVDGRKASENAVAAETCAELEHAFLSASDTEEPACRCMPKDFGRDVGDEEFIFVGCTRQNMPSVYRALHAVNETNITQLTIWDSVINILPGDMFSKVRPRVLSIESSSMSLFRKDPFADLSERLKSLFLRNNILQKIDKQTFTRLHELELLDLSGNKLKSLQRDSFQHLSKLQVLMLASNKLSSIEEGAFENLTNLRTLNLAGNRLKNLTKGMFRGLANLEVLELNDNYLESIDPAAFEGMPKLRSLNLGSNRLKRVELRNLPGLETLFLNNNSIPRVGSVQLRNLPALLTLRLDRNRIRALEAKDMESMRECPKLRSLSLVANNLTRIEADAFSSCAELTTLSLQNNALASLRGDTGEEENAGHGVSWLMPMQKLKRIFLSHNNITTLDNGDLNVVPALEEVSMDNNQLKSINKDAFKGLQLRKLFLNNNNFYYLPEGIFDGWDTERIFSVDLAENPWECICGHEWIGEWLGRLGDRSTPSGNVGCVAYQQQRCELVDEGPKHSAWITVIAGVLAFIALLFLTAIAYLYIQEACQRSPLRRIPSDMVRLIPSVESLSFPNPVVAAEAALKEVNSGGRKTDEVRAAADPNSPYGNQTVVRVEVDAQAEASPTSEDGGAGTPKEKKRVRFDGI